jgi:hypothetical protein
MIHFAGARYLASRPGLWNDMISVQATGYNHFSLMRDEDHSCFIAAS